MVTKAIGYRKWSAGKVTAVFLPQHTSDLGSPSRKVGFEACPGAGPFSRKRWEQRHLGYSSPSPHLNLAEQQPAFAVVRVGCVIRRELQPRTSHGALCFEEASAPSPCLPCGRQRWYTREWQTYPQHVMVRERSRACAADEEESGENRLGQTQRAPEGCRSLPAARGHDSPPCHHPTPTPPRLFSRSAWIIPQPQQNVWVTMANATGQDITCLSLAAPQHPFCICRVGALLRRERLARLCDQAMA